MILMGINKLVETNLKRRECILHKLKSKKTLQKWIDGDDKVSEDSSEIIELTKQCMEEARMKQFMEEQGRDSRFKLFTNRLKLAK